MNEIIISCTGAICFIISPILLTIVNKTSPDNRRIIFFCNLCQHISSICLCSSISKWSWTAFGICFHKETAKVWNPFIYFSNFFFPPGNDVFIKWICTVKSAKLYSCRKIQTQIQTNSIFRKQIRKYFHLPKIFRCNKKCRCIFYIYIIDNNPIDSHTGCHSAIISGSSVNNNLVIFIKE